MGGNFGIITKDPIITEQRVKKFFSSTSEYPEEVLSISNMLTLRML